MEKLNIPEMFNDNNGKTQAVLVCGVVGFFYGLFGMGLCEIYPYVMKLLDMPKDKDLLDYLDEASDRNFQLAGICFTGITAHVFSKDKPLNTPESANLPKPMSIITELESDGVKMKETKNEFKTPE